MRFEIPLMAALIDPSDGMARVLMGELGRHFDRQAVMMDNEKLACYEAVLSEMADISELIRQKAGV